MGNWTRDELSKMDSTELNSENDRSIVRNGLEKIIVAAGIEYKSGRITMEEMIQATRDARDGIDALYAEPTVEEVERSREELVKEEEEGMVRNAYRVMMARETATVGNPSCGFSEEGEEEEEGETEEDDLGCCEECGEELYETSDGVSIRCPNCDDPDPSSYDGGGPDFAEVDDNDDDDQSDDEPDDEPDDDDVMTSDHVTFYQSGKRWLQVDMDATTDEIWSAIDEQMEADGYYPNVWFVSDHGNAHLMTRELV